MRRNRWHSKDYYLTPKEPWWSAVLAFIGMAVFIGAVIILSAAVVGTN